MAVICLATMSRVPAVSANSAPLLDGLVCTSSPRPVSSAVRFRNGNAGRFRNATLSLSFKKDGFLSGAVIFQHGSNSSEVEFANGGQFQARRRWGGVVSVRADAAAVAESEGAEKSSEKDLVDKLLFLVEGSDRGASFGKEEHAKVDEMVCELEQYSIPQPLQSPLIFGDWDVAYSSNPTSPGGGYRSWIGRLIFRTREMIQAINAPDIIVNVVQFLVFGFIPGAVELRGKLEPLDEKLIRIDFEPPVFQLGPLRFQYGKTSSVKIGVIYLNDRVRLGRGSRGTVFVFTKR